MKPVKYLPLRRMLADPLWISLAALVAGGIYYLYNVRIIDPYQDTAFVWLKAHWKNISHYSHGPLIPLIAAGLLWWKRDEFRGVQPQPDWRGVWIVIAAMLLYYVSVKGMVERLIVSSFVVLLYGLALSVGGRVVLRIAFFPITFLFLMIPLNFLEERVGVPLQHWMAIISSVVLNAVGIATQRVGTGIYSEVFRFDVAAPCSGIRSLMALTTVTAAYAYVTQRSQWRRWVLFLSAIPLAVLGNMARVVSIALVAQVYGQEAALRAYHDYSGYIVFGVALSLMVFTGWLLELPYRRLWSQWMKPVKPRNTAGAIP
jgi:exosortase